MIGGAKSDDIFDSDEERTLSNNTVNIGVAKDRESERRGDGS